MNEGAPDPNNEPGIGILNKPPVGNDEVDPKRDELYGAPKRLAPNTGLVVLAGNLKLLLNKEPAAYNY